MISDCDLDLGGFGFLFFCVILVGFFVFFGFDLVGYLWYLRILSEERLICSMGWCGFRFYRKRRLFLFVCFVFLSGLFGDFFLFGLVVG